MRLIIHPGWSKTGTSALQTYFASFYDQYHEQGVLYPKAGRFIDNAHHGLSLAAKPRVGLEFDVPLDRILDDILLEAKTASAKTVVLSSELSPNYFTMPSFERLFDAFEDIVVIFTVRPQSEILVSLYKQLLKDASLDFNTTISDLFLENCDWLNFEATISDWKTASALHRPKFELVVYSPESLIKDFVTTAGIPLFTYENRHNASPSDLATAVLAKTVEFRSTFEHLGIREQFVAYIIENAQGVEIEGFPLSTVDKTFIEMMFDRSNSRVATEFFSRNCLFEGTARDDGNPAMDDGTLRAFAALLMRSFKAVE